MNSIFTPLIKEGLTTLHIRHNFKTGEFRFKAAKDFDSELDFSRYNKDFSLSSILTDDNRYLGTEEVLKLYKYAGLDGYLTSVLELVKKGKHIGIDFCVNNRLNIRFIGGVHSDVLGRNNKSFTTFAGATRRHGLEVEELHVIKDALNLSRAMSFKNVAVNLPYGGRKSTLHMEPLDISDMDKMGFLAYVCDRSNCITGPDMNLPKEMVKVMNDNFSVQYCGGPGSALGDTAVPTALGAYLALKQAVKFKTGTESLDGMTVAVQGLGAVGYAMARLLAREKTKLLVTDIAREKASRLIDEHPGQEITYTEPDKLIYEEADILCPCAMGGIIGDEEIPLLKVKYIFGPANNQLRAAGQEEEVRLAKALDAKGIMFQIEWWHNGAGVLGAAMEYIHGRDIYVTNDDLVRKVEEIVPANTWDNLTRAKELGVTPTEAAYLKCQEVVYG